MVKSGTKLRHKAGDFYAFLRRGAMTPSALSKNRVSTTKIRHFTIISIPTFSFSNTNFLTKSTKKLYEKKIRKSNFQHFSFRSKLHSFTYLRKIKIPIVLLSDPPHFLPKFFSPYSLDSSLALVFKTVTKSRYFPDFLSRDHDFLTISHIYNPLQFTLSTAPKTPIFFSWQGPKLTISKFAGIFKKREFWPKFPAFYESVYGSIIFAASGILVFSPPASSNWVGLIAEKLAR